MPAMGDDKSDERRVGLRIPGRFNVKIVGEDEADINAGMISFSSPIARALIGKNEGDEICFSAPGGEKEYEVIDVRYE